MHMFKIIRRLSGMDHMGIENEDTATATSIFTETTTTKKTSDIVTTTNISVQANIEKTTDTVTTTNTSVGTTTDTVTTTNTSVGTTTTTTTMAKTESRVDLIGRSLTSRTSERGEQKISLIVEDEEEFQRRQSYILKQKQEIDKIKYCQPKYKIFRLQDEIFEVEARYDILNVIGFGAYGIVCSAVDTHTKKKVAIKQIRNIFETVSYAQRTLRELVFLRYFSHENIIGISHVMCPDLDNPSPIYMVSEIMETDLSTVIAGRQRLEEGHIQWFIYQLLKGLKYMHSAGVMHRDLKPTNLLVNAACDLKICDFGLARNVSTDDGAREMSYYIATRWYRAPEVILSRNNYDQAIDMWAVGCIMAELINRKPLFPGRDAVHQLFLILSVLGTSNLRKGDFLDAFPKKKPVRFNKVMPTASLGLCDLVSRLLLFEPVGRLTVEETLRHPYLKDYHFEQDEPTCTTLDKDEFYWENLKTSKDDLKTLLKKEILCNYSHDKDPDSSIGRKKTFQFRDLPLKKKTPTNARIRRRSV